MLRSLAYIVSVVFHPLLILTYMLILLLQINPYLFGINDWSGNVRLILVVFFSTFFIPAFGILMMKSLGMIQSFEMRERQERIGPFILTGVFYTWMFRVFLDNSAIPIAYTTFVLGSVLGLFVCFVINTLYKISLHALGMGGLVGMVVITMWMFSDSVFTMLLPFWGLVQVSMNLVLMIVLFLAGLVGTSRLLLGAHRPMELYSGFLIGLITQFIALRILI